MNPGESFQRLMAELAARDPAAAQAVVRRTYAGITDMIRKRIGHRFQAKVDADSVANSVLTAFFLGHAVTPYPLADWEDIWRLLAEIARNKLFSRLRRFQRLKRRVDAEVDTGAIDPAALVDGPEAQAVVNDLCDFLMTGCGDHERLVIELSVQGYSVEEIAVRVGMSTRTVIRVRTKFRKRLEVELAADG